MRKGEQKERQQQIQPLKNYVNFFLYGHVNILNACHFKQHENKARAQRQKP